MLPFTHLTSAATGRLQKYVLTAGSALLALGLLTGCVSSGAASATNSASSASESAASESAASEAAASESAASAKAYEEAEAAERELEAAKSEAAASSEAAQAEAEASEASESAAAEEAAASSSAAAASASAQAEKDAETEARKKIANAKPVNSRQLQRIVKNPDDHVGETMVIYGRVTQFDSATGECIFRANVGHANMRYDWDYDHNSIFVAGDMESDCPELDDVLQDDEVKVTASVVMSYSYDTQIGGSTTVPMFRVEKIERI
ncbi:hypothetical protein [Neomicrococcus lactis]|uniref:Chemotaxis protein histidine kinase CheA n=2 Tax=Neomicrococcus lactis TaxID=732241 RepID=A0A7W8Y8L2_9MICC|nr:hypothetical protein [Neomicrococcus lactis]MBB5596953.1 chemotaxis protein histidine kinase CheA [Neomicrococcus lactis]